MLLNCEYLIFKNDFHHKKVAIIYKSLYIISNKLYNKLSGGN